MEAERLRQEEAERLRKLEEERQAEERRMLVDINVTIRDRNHQTGVVHTQ